MPDKTPPRIREFALTAHPDVPDFRDFEYRPPLVPLRKELRPPANLHILDQGSEGACTGFALAAVINRLRQQAGRKGQVSARMLYEMAKRHDEWRGFTYEGSSCRGAIKGWYNMGVCLEKTWPFEPGEPGYLTIKAAKEARSNTVGAYYRLGARISDFHAALTETGVIYCSANVHAGWDEVGAKDPLIKPSSEIQGGHAFAIVGYDSRGFWVQNSWRRDWGRNGLALWPYEDWQQNVTDAWAVRMALPTPQVWHLPREGGSEASRSEGLFNRRPTRAEIAGHFVHIDDGHFHAKGRYWSTADDVRQTAELVAASDNYDHLLLYAHGGLNSTSDSARRIASMKETFKANRIYPFHFMYDTGLLEELKDVLKGRHDAASERAGGFTDWMDQLIERASRKAGRALWREMKYGAASPFRDGNAGDSVLRLFLDAFAASGKPKKLHVVGHSTGAILHAWLLGRLLELKDGLRVHSASLLAPAATVALFRSHYRPLLKAPRSAAGINRMDIYNLNDELELDDNVAAVYRKSLLYLVSRAFEEDPRPAGLLGMQRYSRNLATRLPGLKVHFSDGRGGRITASESHGGFDNDPATMNSVLRRVLGQRPAQPFTKKSLAY